jgi:hypothetical protein
MPTSSRSHLRFATLLFVFCALLASGGALAQTCSSDGQCPNGGRSSATCVGDTLVVKRSICAGSCRDVEERRESCGSRVIGSVTCQGNTAVKTEGGCNALAMRCDNRLDREVCISTCACVKNRLVYSSGICTPGSGCGRVVLQCKGGCTCKPEPTCL